MNPEDKSKIEELNKSLYSRSAPEIRQKRRLRFSARDNEPVPTDWKHPDEPIAPREEHEENKMTFISKLFIGSVIFFVCALILGSLFIFRGKNIISANNIDIVVKGPVTIAGGDPIDFDIQVVNKNSVTLETVDLAVSFPAGSVEVIDRTKELRQFKKVIPNIEPGERGEQRVSAVLYGEENTRKQIRVNVSYRVAGSNAVFRKEQTHDVLLSSSPLSLTVNSFKEVTSGQEFGVEVTLASNSSDVIRNLLLRAEFPFGFTLTSAEIKAEGNRATWKVGDVPPNSKKTIRFKGTLEGQDGESRVFKFVVGAQGTQNSGVIATEYIAATKEIAIQKPFISTAIAFENDADGDYVGAFNTPIKATLSWFNNLSSAISDAEIRVKLSGNAFDKVAVAPGAGDYRSANNEIIWNRITTPELAALGAGENGGVYFNFTPHNFSTPSRGVTNPSVTLEVSVQGKRLSESNVPETVVSSAKRTVKIPSNLSLTSRLFRGGPFENTGPIPPKAENRTTYTVTWAVDNTSSTISDAVVKASLPVYVKWLGKVSPTGENITYNANGEVIWSVGNVDTFTVQSGRRRTVSFQIAFEPSVAHVGQIPTLVSDTTVTGVDDFTGVTLTATQSSLDTRFSDNFKDGQDMVAR